MSVSSATAIPERNAQIIHLLDALRSGPDHLLVLLGDINEWRPRAYVRRRLEQFFGPSAGVRTFPARYPVLALARVASDHLPVRGTIVLKEEKRE